MAPLREMKARWDAKGQTEAVKWKWVRRALILGGLSLSVSLCGAVVWVRDQRAQSAAEAASAAYQAEWAQYIQVRGEVTRCEQRVEGSAKLSDLADATSEGFQSVDHTFDRIVGVFEAAAPSPPSPRLIEIRTAVNDLSADVAEVTAAAAAYDRVPASECSRIVVPSRPTPP